MLWGLYSAICELLIHRREKCVEIKGDYIKLKKITFHKEQEYVERSGIRQGNLLRVFFYSYFAKAS